MLVLLNSHVTVYPRALMCPVTVTVTVTVRAVSKFLRVLIVLRSRWSEAIMAVTVCSMRGPGWAYFSRSEALAEVTSRLVYHKHDQAHNSGGSPPGAACDRAKPPHDKMQGSASVRVKAYLF